MASCGHMYHPWCLAIHCTSSLTCKVKGCEQKFESDWRLSSGFSNKAQDDVNSPMQLGPTLFTRVSSNYTNFGEQKFESDWRLSSGFSNKAQDDVNSPMQLGPTLFTRVSSNYTNFASFIAILAHIL